MFEVTLLLVSLLILGTYAMLFWLVKKEYMGLRGAVIMVIVSTSSYLVFPALLARVEVQSAILLLLLFILAGLVLLAAVDRKMALKLNLHANINFRHLTGVNHKLFSSIKPSLVLTASGIKLAFSAVKRFTSLLSDRLRQMNVRAGVKMEKDNMKVQPVREQEKEKKTEAVDFDANIEIIDLSENDQSLSYVDFESKGSDYEDLFEKYIKGEIILSDVSRKIKERLEVHQAQPGNSDEEPEMKREVQAEAASVMEKDFSFKPCSQAEKNNVEACIEKAFDFKAKGQLLEAVECYIKALDKGPEDDLILWIVVDICSLYKQLGQDYMAKEMMMSYIETFGDNLSPQVREEIMGSL